MRKLIFFFVFFVFIGNIFAQKKKDTIGFVSEIVSGNITVNGEPEKKFKILLFDTKKNPKKLIVKYESNEKTNSFNFVLSNEEIRNYNFLEVATPKVSKIFRLSSLYNNGFLDINLKNKTKIHLGYYKKVHEPEVIILEKPAIYIYPEKEAQIDIIHHFKGKITTTYPEYNKGWSLQVKPDGKIYNFNDKKTYNYLFWEGSMKFSDEHYNYKNGFYVEKENYVKFLQEKLNVLALNNTEINDFIVYWLPEMNKYEKVFVHFWINDNIDNCSVLDFNPEPNILIRVFMEFENAKNSENNLPIQVLPKLKREGFTVVEWGGSEINSEKIK